VNSQLGGIPARRAHSNHAEVARNVRIDILSGRHAEGMKPPGDAELTSLLGVSAPMHTGAKKANRDNAATEAQ
jgi:hypothetical protein